MSNLAAVPSVNAPLNAPSENLPPVASAGVGRDAGDLLHLHEHRALVAQIHDVLRSR